jgi:hypothetical protein
MRTVAAAAILGTVVSVLAGCDVNAALERVAEARRLAASMQLQFTKAADASNRAVMADTDEASMAFAREAEEAMDRTQKDAEALSPLLERLDFRTELASVKLFLARFAEYRALERTILDLAVENTNLKAQRLSFSAAQEAADAFRDTLAKVAPDRGEDFWQARALAATAVANVRDIQALQAPHIAEAGDAAMMAIEERMASSEKAARTALQALSPLIRPASRQQLAAATAALDRLMEVNARILGLSRRNSNVRSLALSLNEKRTVAAQCEESLRALHDELAKRGFSSAR